jgi:hypothetical protein
MIIAHAGSEKDPTKRMLVVGLTRGSIRHLTAGKPLRLSRENTAAIPEGWTITILFGEKDRDVARQLQTLGVLGSSSPDQGGAKYPMGDE